MKALILAAIFAVSCNKTEKKPAVYTALQKEYLTSLSLEGKVYMEGCLNGWNDPVKNFNYCIDDYRKLGQAPVVQGGPSTGQIAAGVAIGTIGAKVLTGKRK